MDWNRDRGLGARGSKPSLTGTGALGGPRGLSQAALGLRLTLHRAQPAGAVMASHRYWLAARGRLAGVQPEG